MAADGFARLGQQKATGETEKNALIMFESMIQQADKRGIELQEGRMVSNGALMIFAGKTFLLGKYVLAMLTRVEELAQRPSA